LDNRLRVNAAVFQTEVEDNQFFEFFAGPFGLMRVVTTIDELEIQGFEMDFNAVVTENLSVFGGAGYSWIAKLSAMITVQLSEGNDAPQAPDRTYNLGAQFEMAVASGVEMTARLDWQYVGEMAFHTLQGEATPTIWQVFNGSRFDSGYEQSKRDAYDTLNARISFDAENWGVTIWGRNMTDENYLEEVIPAPEFGGSFIHPGAKDSYGIDFNYRF